MRRTGSKSSSVPIGCESCVRDYSAFRTTWTRPGFLLAVHGEGGGSEQCCDPRLPDLCRGLSRRFNCRWTTRGSPTTGCEAIRSRTTGASLLVAPTDPGLCEDGSATEYVVERLNCMRTRFLSRYRSRCSRLRAEAPRYRLLIRITVDSFTTAGVFGSAGARTGDGVSTGGTYRQ